MNGNNKSFELNDFTIINDPNDTVTYFKNTFNNDELIQTFKLYSSTSKYEDNIWRFDKRYSDRNIITSKTSIYFLDKFKQNINFRIIKDYALLLILNNYAITSARAKVFNIFRILDINENNQKSFDDFNENDIENYYQYLLYSKLSMSSKESHWRDIIMFFNRMGYERPYHMANKYDQFKRNKVNEDKYIPMDIALKLDKIYDNIKIPLYMRTCYWILRLLPNRINEVLSMRIGCLKPYCNNEYALFIPNFKQGGQHILGEERLIIIKYQDMGKYLIDLIKELINESIKLEVIVKDEDKGYLFIHKYTYYNKRTDKYEERNWAYTSKSEAISKMFSNISERECVEYNPTSHQFRHNAITDRVDSGIFRLIDISGLTGHKTVEIIAKNYIHIDQNAIREKQMQVSDGSSGAIYFRGKIISNDNNRRWDKILINPYSHTLGKLGICEDISNCKESIFDCLGCNYFIPNAEDLPYFENQVLQWDNKLKYAYSNDLLRENAIYNIELNLNVVNKIKVLLKGEVYE